MDSKRYAIVVDDEPITRMDISEMLEDMGFLVVGVAADGFDGVTLSRQFKPNLVIMDIKMPIFDGLTASETIIRENLADCVVLLTAYHSQDLIERANRIGVNGYIVKPVQSHTFRPAIEVAMAQSARIQESKKKAEDAMHQIKSNTLINQAKAILAQHYSISESEAYVYLRNTAMSKRCTIASLAEAIISSQSERIAINKAKEALIKRKGFSEKEAYRYILEEAKSRNCSASDFAKMLLENES